MWARARKRMWTKMETTHQKKALVISSRHMGVSKKSVPGTGRHFDVHYLVTPSLQTSKSRTQSFSTHPYGCFSKLCTSEMSRTLQTSTVYFSRVSYLLECSANDAYVLRMTHMDKTLLTAAHQDNGEHSSLGTRMNARTLTTTRS